MIFGCAASNLYAVSDSEMEQARVIAAQWYLRWTNNGSDYLESLHPKTMGELEGKLKAKEKENIKAFKSVAVPKDYANWDKAKLTEYWGTTFFKSSGLKEEGRGARLKVRKLVGQMSVADKSAEKPAEKPTEEAPQLPSAGAPVDTAAPVMADANPLPTAEEVIEEQAAVDSTLGDTEEVEPEVKKNNSSASTWMYVIALILLIGVVIWLVVFASKTMQGGEKKEKEEEEDEAPLAPKAPKRAVKAAPVEAQYSAPEVDSDYADDAPTEKAERSLREKFARTLASKDEEIRVLHREIHDLRDECMKMGEENGRLKSDLTVTQRELEALRGRLRAADAVASAASSAPEKPERLVDEVRPAARRNEKDAPAEERTIYLGRVNSKGIFVRADRKPVEGKSMFMLTTSDGFTGTFRVLQFAPTIDMALENPEYYLAGGCVAPDITDTEEADGIRTVSAGTAIFEEGCWRLLRKAKIAYE